MKALIRNPGEDVLEKDFEVLGIDHEMMTRMCSETWAGGAYRLVENYIPMEESGEIPEEPVQIITAVEPVPADEVKGREDGVLVGEVPKVYHINGKTYTEDELRAMLNQ